MNAKLVGIKNFTSKNGKECTILNIESPFTPAEQGRGCTGLNVQSVFAPNHLVGTFTDKELNKNLELNYIIEGGRAYLNDITVH